MERFDLGNIFQGISTLLQADSAIMYARIGLILLGILLVYLGRRGVLEPLVMIPMGLGMAAVNAGVLIFPGGMHGNLFLDPMVTETDQLMNILQIDFLQPIYTFTFSNGLIACLILFDQNASIPLTPQSEAKSFIPSNTSSLEYPLSSRKSPSISFRYR